MTPDALRSLAKKAGPNVQRAVYLDAAYDLIREELMAEAPARSAVALAFSFPTRGATTAKVIGQCHHLKKSRRKQATKKFLVLHPAIWKSESGLQVVETLAHEMAHAALPEGTKHGAAFKNLVTRIGLTGKPTATVPGPEFKAWFKRAEKKLPRFPGGIDLSFAVKKQTTRLRLFECECEEPVKVRIGRDEFDATCNLCEEPFHRVDS
jgi:hypothetical protein